MLAPITGGLFDRKEISMKRLYLFVVGWLAFAASPACGTEWFLHDGNWSVLLQDEGFYGVVDWTGPSTPDYLSTMTLWYRVGENTNEYPFGGRIVPGQGDLDRTGAVQSATNSLTSYYAATNPQPYAATVTYSLFGGGLVFTSDLFAAITVTNTSLEALDLHIFMTATFKVTNAPETYSQIIDPSLAMQTQASGNVFAATAVSIPSSHYQAGPLNSVFLGVLDSAGPGTLNDDAGPSGPGNATEYGFQWDVTIPAGESWSLDVHSSIGVIPEPASIALVVLGCGALAARKMRGPCQGMCAHPRKKLREQAGRAYRLPSDAHP